jgi:hypothetical protein
MSPAGSYVVGGYTWTSVNSATAQNLRFTNGSGLIIGPSTAGCAYTAATRTAPMVLLRMGSIAPSFSADVHAMKVTARVSAFTAGFNAPHGFFGFENLTNPTNEHAEIALGRNGGVRVYKFRINYASLASETGDDSTTNTDDIVQAEWNEATLRARTALWAGAWPSDAGWRYRGLRNGQNTNGSEGRTTFDMNVAIAADTDGAGGPGTNYDMTVSHLKVEYKIR